MIISLIAAMDEERAIGRENRLPWRLPKDLARFRAITLGHPVIMGRRTYESLGGPLQGRQNIVVTRRTAYRAVGCTVVGDLAAAYASCGGADEAFILGGAELFAQALPSADRIYLTIVHTRIQGDAFFPEIPESFVPVSSEAADDAYPLTFLIYERRQGSGGNRSA